MVKYIFIAGKGGVGKTSLASALALFYSQKEKVLLVSTDPVFALSDLWGVKLTNRPKNIRKNLFAKHINPDYFEGETTSSPCASEKAVVTEFSTHLLAKDHDKIIFDTAPTGHTLQLLKSPKEWKELVEKAPLACGTEEGDEEKYGKVIDILKSNQVIFNFVLIPEKLSIEETKRAIGELAKMGIKRLNFIVNMVIPLKEVKGNEFLKKKLAMQKIRLEEIRKNFGCCPQIVFLQNGEIKGEARLKTIANQLFSGCCF